MTVIAVFTCKNLEESGLSIPRFWVLVLKRGFPLTRFFPVPKNRVKGAVPVIVYFLKTMLQLVTGFLLHQTS